MCFCAISAYAVSCEIVDDDVDKHVHPPVPVSLEDMAHVMAHIPLTGAQMDEVYDAVAASAANGYDEEYTMQNIFSSPGAGVGDDTAAATRTAERYEVPLRQLIEDYLRSGASVKSDVGMLDPDAMMEYITSSDMQIYWPFSEKWDGMSYPVITFDPEDNSTRNIGYMISVDDDGFRRVEQVLVDEEMAENNPVWVVNRNSDAGYKTLELLRREDPDWGNGGGSVIVKPTSSTRAKSKLKTLMLSDFTMNRNYDSWFAGASEFFADRFSRGFYGNDGG